MGMTIDNSIRLLEDYHKWEKQYGIFGSGVDDATNKLLEVAKKYQEIEQIVEEMKSSKSDIVGLYRHNTEYYMNMIERILEDGKID